MSCFTLYQLRNVFCKKHILVFCFLFFAPFSSLGENLANPFFVSKGGTGGASLNEDFSYLINPATIGFQQKTKGAVVYSYKQKQKTAMVSVLDLNSLIPMAMTYQRFWSGSFKKSTKDEIFFSSGLKVTPHLSLGLGVEKQLKEPFFDTITKDWNINIGSALKMGKNTSLAFSINDILKTESKNKKTLSLELSHQWKPFFTSTLSVSKVLRQTWIAGLGLESFIYKYFSIKLGGLWQEKPQQKFLSGGLSFHGHKVSLEIGASLDWDQSSILQEAKTSTTNDTTIKQKLAYQAAFILGFYM